jgi:hypothetical protein
LTSLYSQEKNTLKEVGIYFANLDAFGIRCKYGNEKRMFRLTALSISIGELKYPNVSGYNSPQSRTNSGAGLNVGIEFPVKIADNFSFYYGAEISGQYQHSKEKSTDYLVVVSNTNRFGAGFVMGFSYQLNSNILLSAEIVPGLVYSDLSVDKSTTKSYGFGLDNNSAGITLSYKFNKQK